MLGLLLMEAEWYYEKLLSGKFRLKHLFFVLVHI